MAGKWTLPYDSPGTAEAYNPATETFTATGSMARVRCYHTATVLATGLVLLAGGGGDGASAELYHPATGTFTEIGSMTEGRLGHTATLLDSGTVLLAGGSPCQHLLCGFSTRSAELYVP